MMPTHKDTLAEQYDQSLHFGRVKYLPADAPRPLPTCHWPPEDIELLERYRGWLLGGGVSELVTKLYHVPMAGHVFGLTLKHHSQLDLEHDLECALEYVKAKGVGESWLENCRNLLVKFRRFLRLERGLGEESHVTPFDSARVTAGLPAWLVSELDRYQRLMQRNWRDARMEQNIRRFWSGYLRLWRFFVEQRQVQELKDLKRQHVLDYVDHRLSAGYSVTGVNNDLRNLHVFLYRNAPLKKDIIRAQLKYAGERVGVKVFPHRLRHTCATQLLNAGCRVTSIQRFLGHKELSSTMVYARAHDQTVAEDYFTAMQRVEQRLEILPAQQATILEDVKVRSNSKNPREHRKVFQLIERLKLPELCFEERFGIAVRLAEAFGTINEHAPPENWHKGYIATRIAKFQEPPVLAMTR